MTLEEAQKILMSCDSYSRLPTLLELEPLIEQSDLLKLFGEEWSGFDNIGLYVYQILPLLKGAKAIPEMMDNRELSELRNLPDVFKIYRGCYQNNKCGLSWSLSKDVAAKFPTLYRYRQQGTPLLVIAEVRREDVIAIKLGREEREIITWNPKIIAVSKIAELECTK